MPVNIQELMREHDALKIEFSRLRAEHGDMNVANVQYEKEIERLTAENRQLRIDVLHCGGHAADIMEDKDTQTGMELDDIMRGIKLLAIVRIAKPYLEESPVSNRQAADDRMMIMVKEIAGLGDDEGAVSNRQEKP